MKKQENYLEKIPQKAEINWTSDDDGIVTLEVENKGIVNKICQKLLKKPRISYIHLDKMGSFIWPKIDGEKSVLELAEDVKKEFGNDAEPLYERLAGFIQSLSNCGFVTFKE